MTATVMAVLVACLAWSFWQTIWGTSASKPRQGNHLPESVLRAVANDPSLILYSIDPFAGPSSLATITNATVKFHNFAVLGQTTVPSPDHRSELATTLAQAITNWPGGATTCMFSPRHALRAADGEAAFDILICFECGDIVLTTPQSKGPGEVLHMLPGTAPGPFNAILKSAGVPLPLQPGEFARPQR